MKIGVLKEEKVPADKRVPLTPKQCRLLLDTYPDIEISVKSSAIRCFSDAMYIAEGIDVVDDLNDCDVLIGVKEVPKESLIANKTYLYFSHTIKEQFYNRELLLKMIELNISMVDYEELRNKQGKRLLGFGRYAGIVGAYNGFRAWGLKYDSWNLPKAGPLPNQAALIEKLNSLELPNMKILLTGSGKVSKGAQEMLDAMNIKSVSVDDYLNNTFNEPVYCKIDVLDYNKRKDGNVINVFDFFNNPQDYDSNFMRFANVTDYYIAGHFYGDGAPYLYTRDDVKSKDFNIKVVADVSCDVDGPVATTLRASTIADPIYGYDPESEKEIDFKNEKAITVMAVDNLPCELPQDASEGFGEQFLQHVIPAFFNNDDNGILQRAKITENGKLTERFSYLQDYLDGIE